MSERLVTQPELAEILPIGPRQIRRLVKAGMPTESLGRRTMYPLAQCVAWYIEHRERLAEEALGGAAGARIRKLVADAELAELRAAEIRAGLIPAERFDREMAAVVGRLASEIQAEVPTWALDLAPLEGIPEVVDALEARVHGLRLRLQEALREEAARQAKDDKRPLSPSEGARRP